MITSLLWVTYDPTQITNVNRKEKRNEEKQNGRRTEAPRGYRTQMKGKKKSWRNKSGEGKKKGMKQEKRGGVRSQVKKSQRDSPNESILRPTGADGGRLGPSIIGGGDGAPPLTGEGPYESPVTTRPSIYSGKVELLRLKSGQDQVLLPL